jgi:predicted nucleic acid-binding protein
VDRTARLSAIADTGALYALMDRDDAWHERVTSWWERAREHILVPVTVLPEISYLLASRIGAVAELEFVRAVAAGEFTVEPVLDEDIACAARIMAAYIDTPLGFVDASVAALAERLDTANILTTDRRHFSLLRPRHAGSFRLLP